MLISPVNKSVFNALRAFIVSVLPAGVEVIKGLGNDVPPPKGGYVAMTPLRQPAISTNLHTLNPDQTTTVTAPTEYDVQIDCYGPDSSDWARMLVTMFRDPYGCDSFAASLPGSAPLYCTDPRQAPLITGEENYQQRWVFSALLQYNPEITVAQQSATTLVVVPVNVEATYP